MGRKYGGSAEMQTAITATKQLTQTCTMQMYQES